MFKPFIRNGMVGLIVASATVFATFPEDEITLPLGTPLQGIAATEVARTVQLMTHAVDAAGQPSADEEDHEFFHYQAIFRRGVSGSQKHRQLLLVSNLTDEDVPVVIEFFGEDGRPAELPFQNARGQLAGYYAAANGTIKARGTGQPLLMESTDPVRVGWVRVSSSEPGAIGVTSWQAVEEPGSMGVMAFLAAKATYGPQTVNVENYGSASTFVSLVNPTGAAVNVKLAAYHATGGSPACESKIGLGAGQQAFRLAIDLTRCIRRGAEAYNLVVEAENAPLVVQAYYDYGRNVMTPGVVHTIQLSEPESQSAEEELNTGAPAMPPTAMSAGTGTDSTAATQAALVPLTGSQCAPVFTTASGQRVARFTVTAQDTVVRFKMHFPNAPRERVQECAWATNIKYRSSSPRFVDSMAPQRAKGPLDVTIKLRKNYDKKKSRIAVIRFFMLNDKRNQDGLNLSRGAMVITQSRDKN